MVRNGPAGARLAGSGAAVSDTCWHFTTGMIYLDNNATTPVLAAVAEAMAPFFTGAYGNPASAHAFGRRARQALESARELAASLLGAAPDEVLFTSGATEANNLALFGLAGDPPGHILVSPLEHPSAAEPVRQLAERGFAADLLPVDSLGVVDRTGLLELLRSDTRLVAIQLANHETGVVQPIRDLVDMTAHHSPLTTHHSPLTTHHSPLTTYYQPAFHCDATQAVGKLPVQFHELGVTSLSFSAHKFHGPKGIGVLLVRHARKLRPLHWGGHQQQGRRPGTEPVALAVGLAKALELAHQEMRRRHEHVLKLRRQFLHQLREQAAPVVLNGPDEGMPGFGLPHTLNLSFPGCRAESLLMNLDLAGVACSTGSACSSGSLLPSPVLLAMHVPSEQLESAMRFSLSALLTEAEIDQAAQIIAGVCRRLRQCER